MNRFMPLVRKISLAILFVGLSGCVGIELAMVGAGKSAAAEDTGFLTDYKKLSPTKDPSFPNLPDLWAIDSRIRVPDYSRVIVPDFTSLTTDVKRLAGLQIRQYRNIKQELADQVASTLDGTVVPRVTRTQERVDPKDVAAIRRMPAEAVLLGNIKEIVSLGGENKAGLTGIQIEYKLIDVKTGVEVLSAIHRSTTDLDKVAMAQLRVLTGLLTKAKAMPISPLPQAIVEPPAPVAVEAASVSSAKISASAQSSIATGVSQQIESSTVGVKAVPLTALQAQEALNKFGFPVGKPDGKMGQRTFDALKRFQRARGLPQTGELDEKTSDALRQGTK